MANITLIFLAFALIHSITLSLWFKDRCKRAFGETFMRVWYRLLFTVLSIITAGITFRYIHLMPDQHLWTAPEVLRWSLYALQAAGLVFAAMVFQYLDGLEFLGIRQVIRYYTSKKVEGNIEGLALQGLVTTGVYGMVRHPIYVGSMVFFTCNPVLTVNGLVVTVLADLYFLWGMFIEERRFVRIFGDQYREYMQKVPRMVPFLRSSQRAS